MAGELTRRLGRAPKAVSSDTALPVEWRLIQTPAQPGVRNMAIDMSLMESVRRGAPPVVRFYRWWPPCVSLGRNQEARGHYDVTEAERRGIEFVRRPTGGRAVYHHHEITYSVSVPDRQLGGPRATYRKLHRALAAGLRLLGVPADLAQRSGASSRPGTVPCFRRFDGGAIVANGRKLVGSAQLRREGVLLQHGSILLAGDQSPTTELLKVQRSADRVPEPAALGEILDTQPSWQDLVDTLAAGFERILGVRLTDAELGADELGRVIHHARRFNDPEWTWRA